MGFWGRFRVGFRMCWAGVGGSGCVEGWLGGGLERVED